MSDVTTDVPSGDIGPDEEAFEEALEEALEEVLEEVLEEGDLVEN